MYNKKRKRILEGGKNSAPGRSDASHPIRTRGSITTTQTFLRLHSLSLGGRRLALSPSQSPRTAAAATTHSLRRPQRVRAANEPGDDCRLHSEPTATAYN
jgi:hypothetical protein